MSESETISDCYLEWKNVEIYAKDMTHYKKDDVKRPADAITVKGKTYKRILKNVSGFAKPKELVGIIGPSGAGKTTLLEYLGTRMLPTEDVFVTPESVRHINGKHYDKELFNTFGSFI